MNANRLCIAMLFSGISSVSFCATYTFEGGVVAIPEMGPADPSFIEVQGVSGRVTDISVEILGLDHKYGGETMAAISNPDGWTTLLWAGVSCKFNTIDLSFNDRFSETIKPKCTQSSGLPSGKYLSGESGNNTYRFTIPIAPIRPFFSKLNEMIQDELNGRWILWLEDFANGDGGAIKKWKITFTTQD